MSKPATASVRSILVVALFAFVVGSAYAGSGASLIVGDPAVDFDPAWSPNGATIVFSSTRSGPPTLWTIPVAGGLATQLTTGSNDQGASWSRDGLTIAFGGTGTGGNLDIFTVPALGGLPTQITFDAAADFHPSFTDDGSQIVFNSDRSGNLDLWIIGTPRGTGATQLTTYTGFDAYPAVSPDGMCVAFVSDRADQTLRGDPVPRAGSNQNIWVMPISGGTPVQVTFDPGIDMEPTWSPDGQWIAWASSRTGGLDIYAIQFSTALMATQGSPMQVTNDPQVDQDPTWSGTTNQIGFESFRSGSGDIYAIDANFTPVLESSWGAIKARFQD